MKKLYWRPQQISLKLLWIVAAVAIIGLVMVETWQVRERQPNYREKIRASRLALNAFEIIKMEHLKRKLPIDTESDPAQSGIIGKLLTTVTTNPGHLPSKQTSVNPNFAAVIVHYLLRAGVHEGDTVGIGVSGSFPAINMCVMAAVQILKLKPIMISSAGSSQWGANNPTLMWPDMEKALYDQKIFTFKSVAVSRGGIEDRALGLSKEARAYIDNRITELGYPLLSAKSFQESVEKRMELYMANAGEADIRTYINVGGGTTSVGTKVGKRMFRPGLNRSMPRAAGDIESVMTSFSSEGVPIIHLTKINNIATRFGLPLQPQVIPTVGEGMVFIRETYNQWLVGGALFAILLLLGAFFRFDWGYRIFTTSRREKKSGHPEKMV